jgi:hypothetical protein
MAIEFGGKGLKELIADNSTAIRLFKEGYSAIMNHRGEYVLYDAKAQGLPDIATFETLDELNRAVKLLIGGELDGG